MDTFIKYTWKNVTISFHLKCSAFYFPFFVLDYYYYVFFNLNVWLMKRLSQKDWKKICSVSLRQEKSGFHNVIEKTKKQKERPASSVDEFGDPNNDDRPRVSMKSLQITKVHGKYWETWLIGKSYFFGILITVIWCHLRHAISLSISNNIISKKYHWNVYFTSWNWL